MASRPWITWDSVGFRGEAFSLNPNESRLEWGRNQAFTSQLEPIQRTFNSTTSAHCHDKGWF